MFRAGRLARPLFWMKKTMSVALRGLLRALVPCLLALPLAALHYVWLVKADIRTPLAYAALIGLLLLARVPAVRGWLSGLRRKPRLQNQLPR